MNEETDRMNRRLLEHLAFFLNSRPGDVSRDTLKTLTEQTGLSEAEAYPYLLAAGMELDAAAADRRLFALYFPKMVHRLDAEEYRQDPYYQNVRLPAESEGGWQLTQNAYQPYEAFVCGDFHYEPDGRVIPQIGYFPERFDYPAVSQNGREWMSITPNEITTMAPVIAEAHGDVLTYGLGLGYFAYMACRRPEVRSVTVVENSADAVRLFRQKILPQFEQPQKLRILQEDAFQFAQTNRREYDLTFADLWHDAGDGVECYRRLKPLERGHTRYWIYETMRYYLQES